MPRSRTHNGAAWIRAQNRNRYVDYPDVEQSSAAQLLSLGMETYGRWSSQCLTLIKQLAKYKASNVPDYLQKAVQYGCYAKWWTLLSVHVQVIVGDSILRPSGSDLQATAESIEMPHLDDLVDFSF